MPFLTIFTPSYNRAHTLPRTYESLCRQNCKDFVWLIVDDGSTDDTAELVNEWIDSEKSFEIRYVYKENGGLHTGYNKAIELLDTELAVCVDSDDWLTDNAVDKIISYWKKYGDSSVAGIAALDMYVSGEIIGDRFPELSTINLIDMQIGKYHIKNGDKKLVVRSDLYKSVAPQKTCNGEKNFNPHYMHLQISKKYDFLVLNEPLCVVEYQQNGMTNNIYRQYRNSPNSFAELRKLTLTFEQAELPYKFRQYIHLVSSCLLAKDFSYCKDVPEPLLLVASFPLGIVLFLFILCKTQK